jgi:hypothetical protein
MVENLQQSASFTKCIHDVHHAVKECNCNAVLVLLVDGADPNAVCCCIETTGDQPAHVAARLGYLDCMELLIAYGARMGRRNYAGLTPIGEARMHGHSRVVELINSTFDLKQGRKEEEDRHIDTHNDARNSTATGPDQHLMEALSWQQVYDIENQATYFVRNNDNKNKVDIYRGIYDKTTKVRAANGVEMAPKPPAIAHEEIEHARQHLEVLHYPRKHDQIFEDEVVTKCREFEVKRRKDLQSLAYFETRTKAVARLQTGLVRFRFRVKRRKEQQQNQSATKIQSDLRKRCVVDCPCSSYCLIENFFNIHFRPFLFVPFSHLALV